MSPARTKISVDLDPLKDLLEHVLSRLEALEANAGIIVPPSSAAAATAGAPATRDLAANNASSVVVGNMASSLALLGGGSTHSLSAGTAIPPSIKAYDDHVKKVVVPFAVACDDLGGLDKIGQWIQEAWEGLRAVVMVGTKAKMPADHATMVQELQPLLVPTQQAVQRIRSLRLDRKWDSHHKAIQEMLACCSWIVIKPPSGPLPGVFVRDALASNDFWSNRIRKEFKGKDDKQIAFCDALKAMLVDLQEYVNEYHKFGLNWNAKSGVSLAEAIVLMNDAASSMMAMTDESESGGLVVMGPGGEMMMSPKRRRPTAVGGGTGGMSTLVAELSKRRSADGETAATGLKHVSRDQQTWRKEYKKPDGTAAPANAVADKKKEITLKKKKPAGLPICEYQERGHKWVIENQTKDIVQKEHENGVLVVEVTDPKQQVYMFHCDSVTVQIKGGKFKSMIVDSCQNCNIIFDTVISAFEVVNCKKIQAQTTGICPVFSIDKTDGCLVYLSTETVSITQFSTSQSSEMNVSYPDEVTGDQKELPIPEQFVHKLVNGSVTSEVSELYHR